MPQMYHMYTPGQSESHLKPVLTKVLRQIVLQKLTIAIDFEEAKVVEQGLRDSDMSMKLSEFRQSLHIMNRIRGHTT